MCASIESRTTATKAATNMPSGSCYGPCLPELQHTDDLVIRVRTPLSDTRGECTGGGELAARFVRQAFGSNRVGTGVAFGRIIVIVVAAGGALGGSEFDVLRLRHRGFKQWWPLGVRFPLQRHRFALQRFPAAAFWACRMGSSHRRNEKQRPIERERISVVIGTNVRLYQKSTI